MALEQQKLEYERQFEQLRSAMSPSAPGPLGGLDGGRRGASLYSPLAQSRLEQWARDRSVRDRSISGKSGPSTGQVIFISGPAGRRNWIIISG